MAVTLYTAADTNELHTRLAGILPLRMQPLLHVEQLLVDSDWHTAAGFRYSHGALQDICRDACGGLRTLVKSLHASRDLADGSQLAARVFNAVVTANFAKFRGRQLALDFAQYQIVGCRRRTLPDYSFSANLEAALAVRSWEFRFASYGSRELTTWFQLRRSPAYEVVDSRGRTHRLVAGRIFRVSDRSHYYTRGAVAILRARAGTLGFASYGLSVLTPEQPKLHTADEYVKIALHALRHLEDYEARRVNITLARLATTPLLPGVGTAAQYSIRARRLAHQLRTQLPGALVNELLERSLLRKLDVSAPAYLRRLPVTSAAQWPAVAGSRRFDLLNALLCTQGPQCREVYRWRLAYAANAMLRGSAQVLFSGRNNKHA